MEGYRVVWSGEIDKRMHDQQLRPAPPIQVQSEAKVLDKRKIKRGCNAKWSDPWLKLSAGERQRRSALAKVR